MKTNLFIGLGGFFGAISRLLLSLLPLGAVFPLPVGTLLANVLGSFILGFIFIAAIDRWGIKPEVRAGVTTGYLGGLTTFSTLCKQTVLLLQAEQFVIAALYILLSLALGLGAAWAGIALAGWVEKRRRMVAQPGTDILEQEREAE